MKTVSNSGPILSFARAHHLDLLREVAGTLIIPEAVYEDIVIRGAGKPGAEEVRQSPWIIRERVRDQSLVDQLPKKLHVGEREAIVLAKELSAVLLIDEHEAREEATRLGIDHFGSLRVLKEALSYLPKAHPAANTTPKPSQGIREHARRWVSSGRITWASAARAGEGRHARIENYFTRSTRWLCRRVARAGCMLCWAAAPCRCASHFLRRRRTLLDVILFGLPTCSPIP